VADETPQTQPAEPARAPVSTMAETPGVITQRGLDERPPDEPESGPDYDAVWGALGEEAQKLREGKKWEDPAELVKAHLEATKRLSQRDEEKEALIRYIQELEEQVPENPQTQQAPAAQSGQPQALDFDALAAQCIDPNTGEMNYGRMMELASALGARMAFDASEQRMNERFGQFEKERVSPLAERAEVDRLAEELRSVESVYGTERYEQIGAKIEEQMADNPDYLDQFGGVRGAFAEMAFQMQREEAEAQARSADGYTLTGGGRRPQAPRLSAEDMEREAMERLAIRPSDGL
jgi:hypothetical protein